MSKKFASGVSGKKLFWIFVIGCIFGAFYEEILFMYKNYVASGTLIWEPRRGVFWGPLSPVYGLGAFLMGKYLCGKNDSLLITFLKASLLGGLTEYIINFLQETFLGTTSWNYAGYFLNINGRTTLPYMLFWGVLGIIFVKFIYPVLSKIIESVPVDIGEKLTKILIIVLILDFTVSWTALIRQTLRHYGVRQITIIDKLYDEHYNDEYIYKKFPNMVKAR